MELTSKLYSGVYPNNIQLLIEVLMDSSKFEIDQTITIRTNNFMYDERHKIDDQLYLNFGNDDYKAQILMGRQRYYSFKVDKLKIASYDIIGRENITHEVYSFTPQGESDVTKSSKMFIQGRGGFIVDFSFNERYKIALKKANIFEQFLRIGSSISIVFLLWKIYVLFLTLKYKNWLGKTLKNISDHNNAPIETEVDESLKLKGDGNINMSAHGSSILTKSSKFKNNLGKK